VPIAFGGYLGDFKESYLRAAAQLVAGRDPYDLLAIRRQRTDLIRLTNTVPTNKKTTALEKTTR
jgi:hypothetical protein